MGSIYKISESYGQGKKKIFEVVFEKAECEVNCICSKFQFRRILCKHALAVLIHNSVEVLPEVYILSRWRKDVRRCYSKIKVSYSVQNLSIQQERYEKMCIYQFSPSMTYQGSKNENFQQLLQQQCNEDNNHDA